MPDPEIDRLRAALLPFAEMDEDFARVNGWWPEVREARFALAAPPAPAPDAECEAQAQAASEAAHPEPPKHPCPNCDRHTIPVDRHGLLWVCCVCGWRGEMPVSAVAAAEAAIRADQQIDRLLSWLRIRMRQRAHLFAILAGNPLLHNERYYRSAGASTAMENTANELHLWAKQIPADFDPSQEPERCAAIDRTGQPATGGEEIDRDDVMSGPDAPPTIGQIRSQEGM